ncbi:IS3 family transposase [Patescibacteria group bacterium]|nr:IS3 family transposase [Patescibacteria group bacterium]
MNKEHFNISLLRQSALLDISRSSIYYQPTVKKEDILIMNAIDEIFTKYPFYGHRRIKPELKEEYSVNIGKKRIISLMHEMGLNAIYPRKKLNLSDPNKQHKKFPYLLKDFPIIRPNQVWGTDITYIKLKSHFAYLVAIIDWHSRYVISWKLSSTLENIFCIQALKEALAVNITDIHNSDQGAQYTSIDYINVLEENKIRISMDGRGRCMDNIFTERLWRTVKYENVYLNEYADIGEAGQGLREYFKFYNEKRRHQSLDYKTPYSKDHIYN